MCGRIVGQEVGTFSSNTAWQMDGTLKRVALHFNIKYRLLYIHIYRPGFVEPKAHYMYILHIYFYKRDKHHCIFYIQHYMRPVSLCLSSYYCLCIDLSKIIITSRDSIRLFVHYMSLCQNHNTHYKHGGTTVTSVCQYHTTPYKHGGTTDTASIET